MMDELDEHSQIEIIEEPDDDIEIDYHEYGYGQVNDYQDQDFQGLHDLELNNGPYQNQSGTLEIERSYYCDYCEDCFDTLTELQIHLENHELERDTSLSHGGGDGSSSPISSIRIQSVKGNITNETNDGSQDQDEYKQHSSHNNENDDDQSLQDERMNTNAGSTSGSLPPEWASHFDFGNHFLIGDGESTINDHEQQQQTSNHLDLNSNRRRMRMSTGGFSNSKLGSSVSGNNSRNQDTLQLQLQQEFHTCQFCGLKCKNRSGLSYHIRIKHRSGSEGGSRTPSSTVTTTGSTSSPRSTTTTDADVSYDNSMEYECHACYQQFDDITLFTEHLNSHIAHVNYQCNVCGKTFSFSSGLSRHRKSTGHYDYVGGGGTQKSNVTTTTTNTTIIPNLEAYDNKHNISSQEAHSNNSNSILNIKLQSNSKDNAIVNVKPIYPKCSTCKKRFRNHAALKSHYTRFHSGHGVPTSTASTATIVNQPQSLSLQSEIQGQTKDSPKDQVEYSCTNCEQLFLSYSGLLEHLEDRHKHNFHDQDISHMVTIPQSIKLGVWPSTSKQSSEMFKKPLKFQALVLSPQKPPNRANIPIPSTSTSQQKQQHLLYTTNNSGLGRSSPSKIKVKTNHVISPSPNKINTNMMNAFRINTATTHLTPQIKKTAAVNATATVLKVPPKSNIFVRPPSFALQSAQRNINILRRPPRLQPAPGPIINSLSPSKAKLFIPSHSTQDISISNFINHTNTNSQSMSSEDIISQTHETICWICKEEFAEVIQMQEHYRQVHMKAKKFDCEHCHKRFGSRTQLTMHTRIHTGEKPFACRYCGRRFRITNLLVKHERVHTGEKPFKCEFCGTAFSQSSTLKVHRRSHTGERPYKCDLCDADFTSNTSLREHRRRHTGEKPYRCEFCDYRFTDKSTMYSHRRRCKKRFVELEEEEDVIPYSLN